MVAPENSKPRKRIWQYTFVFGMAACIVAAIVVFGMSSFTTLLTVSGIIIGLFNAFLGSSSTANEGNWFLSRIKHTLDVSNFLRVATVVVWLATFGVVGYGGFHAYREAQKITVSGRVLTAAGDPAANATVVLLLQNRQEAITTADGSFSFTSIDLSQEPLKEIKVRVEWKNRIMEEPVNLAVDRRLTLKFPAGDPPFRVSYITLEGAAIDLLLRGQIDKRWEERLSGQPFIVQNSVFNSLKGLTKNFSTKLEASDGQSFSVANDSGEREDESLATRTVGKSLFVGSSSGAINRAASREDLLSLSKPEQAWSAEVGEGDPADVLSSLSFWKFARREDLSRFQGEEADFYEYVTRTSMPADFCIITLSFGSCAEAGVVHLEPPILKLRIAVLENVSPGPIRIGQFLAHEFKDESLRPREQEEGLLKGFKAEQQSLFPLETLGPRERLVIPLDMPMTYPDTYETPAPKSSTLTSVRRNLEAMPVITIPAGESGESLDLESGPLLAMLNKPPQSEMREKEYVFGPSMNIESVIVDGVSYPFRQFDISKLVISTGGGEIGSCPFVYTYSTESGKWQKEGHILYGRNSSFKESTDEKRLRRFDGRLIIKEEDPEQSFIDFVYIKVTLIDGREELLYPLNQALRLQDGNYLRMEQGQEIELQFDEPPQRFVRSFVIVSRGYYIPYARFLNTTVQKK